MSLSDQLCGDFAKLTQTLVVHLATPMVVATCCFSLRSSWLRKSKQCWDIDSIAAQFDRGINLLTWTSLIPALPRAVCMIPELDYQVFSLSTQQYHGCAQESFPAKTAVKHHSFKHRLFCSVLTASSSHSFSGICPTWQPCWMSGSESRSVSLGLSRYYLNSIFQFPATQLWLSCSDSSWYCSRLPQSPLCSQKQ
jgi:hypothetical protein